MPKAQTKEAGEATKEKEVAKEKEVTEEKEVAKEKEIAEEKEVAKEKEVAEEKEVAKEKEVAEEYDKAGKETDDVDLKKLLFRIRDNELYHIEVFNDLLEEEER